MSSTSDRFLGRAGVGVVVASSLLPLTSCTADRSPTTAPEESQPLNSIFGHDTSGLGTEYLPIFRTLFWRLAVSEANCLLAEKIDLDTGESSFRFAVFPEGTIVEEVNGIATVTVPTGEVIRQGNYVVEVDKGQGDTSARADLSAACQAEADQYPLVHHVGQGDLMAVTDSPAKLGLTLPTLDPQPDEAVE